MTFKRSKEQQRAEWMGNFESALQMECESRGIPYPAGRIDWNFPTYHYLNGEGFAVAARKYADAYLT